MQGDLDFNDGNPSQSDQTTQRNRVCYSESMKGGGFQKHHLNSYRMVEHRGWWGENEIEVGSLKQKRQRTECELPGRLQGCINAVQQIIANSIALNTVLKVACTILDRLLPLTAPAPWFPMYRNATAHESPVEEFYALLSLPTDEEEKTHSVNSRSTKQLPNDDDAWKRTPERILSGPWELR